MSKGLLIRVLRHIGGLMSYAKKNNPKHVHFRWSGDRHMSYSIAAEVPIIADTARNVVRKLQSKTGRETGSATFDPPLDG